MRKFHKLKTKLIHFLGGVELADVQAEELLEVLKDKVTPLEKRIILAEAVKHLWKAVTAEDILRITEKGAMFEGRSVTNAEMASLQEEAQRFTSMRLFKVLHADIKYQIGKKMFEEARVADDVVWGQLLVFLYDIIETRIQNLTRLK